jgi:hypothetical protein
MLIVHIFFASFTFFGFSCCSLGDEIEIVSTVGGASHIVIISGFFEEEGKAKTD